MATSRERASEVAGGRERGQRTRDHTHHHALGLQDRVGNREAIRSARVRKPDEVAAGAAHEAARAPRGPLPHQATAERALGVDLSWVTATIAPDSCAALGAEAFTAGGVTAFSRSPDPATVIHEATHAVQQRGARGTVDRDRLAIEPRGGVAEAEADRRASGDRSALRTDRAAALALKPKGGDNGITNGKIPLLISLGGSKRADLDPGTRVHVVAMHGPAYQVVVASGPHSGAPGFLPGYALDDAPTPPPEPTRAEPAKPSLLFPLFPLFQLPGTSSSFTASGRDPSGLSDDQLRKEINDTDSWIGENMNAFPQPPEYPQMEAYSMVLRAEYQKRRGAPKSALSLFDDEPIKLNIDGPIYIPLGHDDKTLAMLNAYRGSPGAAYTPSVPTGAQVMGNQYFGGENWIYTYPMKKDLPIPWGIDSRQRGLLAEPILTEEYYSPLNPVRLPRGFPGVDLSFGGIYEPIEGTQWLKDQALGKSVATPYVGWQITAPSVVGLKTLDIKSPYYRQISDKPWSDETKLYETLRTYVEEIASPLRVQGQTDVEKAPGLPRFRVVLVEQGEKILHIQLSGEPDEMQSQEIARIQEEALSVGVKMVVFGPKVNYGKSTVITAAGLPAPTYIPSLPQLTVSPKFERRQALGQGAQLVAQLAFGVLNDIGTSIQQDDAKEAFNRELATVQSTLKDQPEMGASIWITWYRGNAPWFSLNQPGPMFGGIQTVYEREPSDTPGAGLYKSNLAGHSLQRVWIPPAAIKPITPQEESKVKQRLDGVWKSIERLQNSVDEFAGEGSMARAWHRRIGKFTGHEMDDPRYQYSLAKDAFEAGDLAGAEQYIYKANELLRGIEKKMRIYPGPPWWKN